MLTNRSLVRRIFERLSGSLRTLLVVLIMPLIVGVATPSLASDWTEPALASNYASLIEMAQEQRTIRIIVGLRTPFQAEGRLDSATAVERQREGIARAQQAMLQRLSGHRLRVLHDYEYLPFLSMQVDAAAMEALAADPGVSSIQADIKQSAALFDNVAFVGGDPRGSFSGFTGEGQTVAVLDSGVDSSHAFLEGKVVSEACYSTPDTNNGETSLCPNGETSQIGPGSARPGCEFQVCDHGTHVAGIIAGKQLDVDFAVYGVQTLSGVAKGASIIAIQVFERDPGDKISTYPSDQVKALERVYELRDQFRIAAVNMSLGGQRYTSQAECDALNPSIKAAIDMLRSVGIATIVASGNVGYTDATSSPACISSAISVGSVGYNQFSVWVAPTSNRASWLSLYAPGVEIVSAGYGDSGAWTVKSGTSQAAPHVAGAWAVLRQKAPTASIDETLAALQSTGIDVPDVLNTFIKKRIRIDAAVEQLTGVVPCEDCTLAVWLPFVAR